MNDNRYCESCGALLAPQAVLCGECGARYQDSPYERRGTALPGAWAAQAGSVSVSWSKRRKDDARQAGELRSSPSGPGHPPERRREDNSRYDGQMSAPVTPTTTPAPSGTLAYPLDGCVPGKLGSRFLAYLIDSLVDALVRSPLLIGLILAMVREEIGTAPFVLVGVGAAVLCGYVLFLVWLMGAKGLTPGWKVMGLRLVRVSTGAPVGWWRSLGRYILFLLFPALLGASAWWDPARHGRAWHDRASDAILVDRSRGRDPIRPRPDDFARPCADHYMTAGAVEVAAHKNLLSEPGAPWKAPTQSSPAQMSSPQQEFRQPSRSSLAAAVDVPGPTGAWAPRDLSMQGQETPPLTSAAPQPESTTELAQEQMTQGADDDVENLEATRVAPPRHVQGIVVTLDDGTKITSDRAAVLGRNPQLGPGEKAVVVADETRSVSKTHLRVHNEAGILHVTDLGSANGSRLRNSAGGTITLEPHTPRVIQPGTTIEIGQRTVLIERNG